MASPLTFETYRQAARVVVAPPAEPSRRVLNFIVALTALVLLAPLMLLIALLVRVSSRGPILYTQTRVGMDRRRARFAPHDAGRGEDLGGRPFTIYKFRTMRVQHDARQVWARPDDDRITAVGRALRRTRLDELPQLFNVLRGDMNVVGPRPEQPEIFARLRERIDRYARRQQVLPGITGWAQVNLGYDRDVDDVRRKLEFDLEYLRRRSPLEDALIMLRTVPVMLGRRGI